MDSSDEEHAHQALSDSSDDSGDEGILGVGRRIVKKPVAFVAGPASGAAAGANAARLQSSPGGTKQTGLDELLREKMRTDRLTTKKQLAMDEEFGERGAGDEHDVSDTALMAEHRQLVDGWSDDEDEDDAMPCAFARWEAADAWEELPHYVPPVDRHLARTDAVARSFRDAHKRGLASDLRLLLAAHKPQLAGRTVAATQPAVLCWLLGLTACSFDEGVATNAFELLSLLLAKADGLPTIASEQWPSLSLIAEYLNLYGTTRPLPTLRSELVMERYRAPALPAALPGLAAAAGGGAAATSPASHSPGRPRSPARKKRRGEIEVPGLGDTVKVKFKGRGGSHDTFFDGKVIATHASTGGGKFAPESGVVLACNGSALTERDFVVFFASDEEYWRLDAKQKNLFKIKRRVPKKKRLSQQQQTVASPGAAAAAADVSTDELADQSVGSIAMLDDEALFPAANLRLVFTLVEEVVRRAGYPAEERSTALGLVGLCAMVAADPSLARASLAARALLAALLDARLQEQPTDAAAAVQGTTPVEALGSALVAAMVPPPQQPASGEAADTAASAATLSADATAVTPEDAWRERHAAEVLWGLPPTVAGAVVRLYSTVQLLHGALERFLLAPPSPPPSPPPKAASDGAGSPSPPPAAVSREDCEGLLAGGNEAIRLAVRLADAAVAACGGSVADRLAPEEAQSTPEEKDKSALLQVSSLLQELLRSVCKLLDDVKVQLGAAVHSVRDEGWVLSQLRLVEGVAESAERKYTPQSSPQRDDQVQL